MVKLIGPKKIRTAVFISGTGSNLKNLIEFSLKKVSPIEVNLIVSNNLKVVCQCAPKAPSRLINSIRRCI